MIQEMVQLLAHESAPSFAKDMYISEHIKKEIHAALDHHHRKNGTNHDMHHDDTSFQSQHGLEEVEVSRNGTADVPGEDGGLDVNLDEINAADASAHCPPNRVIIRPGYTPGLPFMGHLWEPLKWHYRCVYAPTSRCTGLFG